MADQNINNMTVTWNSGGTTFNALKMNVTDTASAVASLLLLLQVGGSDKFKVGKDGTITGAGNLSIAGNATISGNLTVAGVLTPTGGIAGTMTGPALSTDNAIARFNGTTGGTLQNSGVTIDDNNVISATVAAAGTALSLASSDSGVSGLDVVVFKNSASPAASDELARIIALGNDSGGNQTVYSYFIFRLLDPTNGSEDGAFELYTVKAGAIGQAAYFDRVANSITGNTTINGTLTVTG